MQLLISLFQWFVSAAVTLLYLTPAIMICKIAPHVSGRLLRSWSRIQLRIFGVEVMVEDRNQGHYEFPPYLYVLLNQTSLSETFIVNATIPAECYVLMNLGYALLPFVGWLTWLRGGVTIILQWPRQIRKGMDKVIKLLQHGQNFYMSIEGRRSCDSQLLPYKKGAAVLALQSGAKIVPMIIHGARDILPFGEWRLRPGRVKVIFCETIETRGLTYENRDEIVGQLRKLAEKELQY